MPTAELGLFVEMMQVGLIQFGRQLFVSKCQFCSLTGEYEISDLETNNTIWLIQQNQRVVWNRLLDRQWR